MSRLDFRREAMVKDKEAGILAEEDSPNESPRGDGRTREACDAQQPDSVLSSAGGDGDFVERLAYTGDRYPSRIRGLVDLGQCEDLERNFRPLFGADIVEIVYEF